MESKHIAAVMAAVMDELNHFDEIHADGFWHDVMGKFIDRFRFHEEYAAPVTIEKAASYIFWMLQKAYDKGFEDCADLRNDD